MTFVTFVKFLIAIPVFKKILLSLNNSTNIIFGQNQFANYGTSMLPFVNHDDIKKKGKHTCFPLFRYLATGLFISLSLMISSKTFFGKAPACIIG